MPAAPLAADLELFIRPCSDCRKPIMWAKTVASGEKEWMPVGAEPVDIRSGNVIVYPDPNDHRRLLADVVVDRLRRDGMASDGWTFRLHHRFDCPHADRWARQPKHRRPKPTGVRPSPAVDTTTPDQGATLW